MQHPLDFVKKREPFSNNSSPQNNAANERIKELEKLIHLHNKKYFIDNNPEISDVEFDQLTEELRRLNPNSPVLYELVGEQGSVTHPEPMLSLDKKYTYADIRTWLEDINDTEYLIEPKYDGMAARYQNKSLATRGNGIQGEDISARLNKLNVIGDLPTDPNSWTYGEVIIPLSYFNEHLAHTYKNPRNAVVGIVKAKQVKPEGLQALLEGGVHLVVYDKAKSKRVSKEDLLDEAKWEEILEETLRTDYPLDGIVIKAVSEMIRSARGTTQHHNKWQVAYKMPAERKWTHVVDIKDQVGRTGRITSVAVVDPVELSGATVTNITLHNYEYLKDSGIDIDSEVEVTRSGEVIPFITSVKPKKSKKAKNHYTPPTACPMCSHPLRVSGKYLECANKDCPARLAQFYEYFFKVLQVEELGAKTIERFVNEFAIRDVVDFYNLQPEQIAPLNGYGTKSATNIVRNIQSTLNETITQYQLLQALGIKEIGPAASKWILNHYKFASLNKLTQKDLLQIKGLGEVKAQNFIDQINEKWPIIQNLQSRGLKFKKEHKTNSLSGKTFAITGSFDNYSRDDIIKLIEQNGGEYKSAITKTLDYLIVGANPGSKIQKIANSPTITINLEQFKTII